MVIIEIASLAIHRSGSGCDTTRCGGILKNSQFHRPLSRYNTPPLDEMIVKHKIAIRVVSASELRLHGKVCFEELSKEWI
jgi:hypothetical protein